MGCFVVLLKTCLICVRNFVRRVDKSLLEHLDEQAMNLCLYGFLGIFAFQYICMANLAHRVLSLFQMRRGPIYFVAEKSVILYVRLTESEFIPSLSAKIHADIM